MVSEVKIPKFTENMQEATVVRWLKREGDRVEAGEAIVEVLGEKLTYSLESMASGTLLRILAPDDAVVPVLETIAIIGEQGEPIPDIRTTVTPREIVEEPQVTRTREAIGEKMRISPLARKLIEEHKLDSERIVGTGPGGRITRDDVLKAIEKMRAGTAVEAPEELRVAQVIPLAGMRRTIADRMSMSYRTAPHLTITMEANVTELVALRSELLRDIQETSNVRLTFTHMIVKAAAMALREHPILNSSLDGERIKVFEDVNVGVAIAVEDGLVVPVIRAADRKPLAEIAAEATQLVEKAKGNKLSSREVAAGTFTVTNLGMYGVEAFTPIINPPQSAILGVGRILEKPVVSEGKVLVGSTMMLSLTFDHRVLDGVVAAKFLETLKGLLEKPRGLL